MKTVKSFCLVRRLFIRGLKVAPMIEFAQASAVNDIYAIRMSDIRSITC